MPPQVCEELWSPSWVGAKRLQPDRWRTTGALGSLSLV